MSESMVERVARALCVSNGDNPDADWGGKPAWTEYTDDARAAIEAMREPTGAMIVAGWHEIRARLADPDGPCITHNPAKTYDAMIDAALSEAPQAGA